MLFWFSLVPRPSQYSNGRWQRLESCWILSHDTHLMFIFTALFMGSNIAGRKWYFLISPLQYPSSTPFVHPYHSQPQTKRKAGTHFISFVSIQDPGSGDDVLKPGRIRGSCKTPGCEGDIAV